MQESGGPIVTTAPPVVVTGTAPVTTTTPTTVTAGGRTVTSTTGQPTDQGPSDTLPAANNGQAAGHPAAPDGAKTSGQQGSEAPTPASSEPNPADPQPVTTSGGKTFGKWTIRIIFTPIMFFVGTGIGMYCGLVLGVGVPMLASIKRLFERTDSWLLVIFVFPFIAFAGLVCGLIGSAVGFICGAVIFSAATARLDTKPLKYADDQVRAMFDTLIWNKEQQESTNGPVPNLSGQTAPHQLPEPGNAGGAPAAQLPTPQVLAAAAAQLEEMQAQQATESV